MAMISCPECGREVSGSADACPHCGFPMRENDAGARLVRNIGLTTSVVGLAVSIYSWVMFSAARDTHTDLYQRGSSLSAKYQDATMLMESWRLILAGSLFVLAVGAALLVAGLIARKRRRKK